MDVKYRLYRDLENKDVIKVEYVNTSDQIADILTKALLYMQHSLNMKDSSGKMVELKKNPIKDYEELLRANQDLLYGPLP